MIDDLVPFWFSEESRTYWWEQSDEYDELLRSRFGNLPDEVLSGLHDSKKDTPEGLLSLIISLDQLPRNLFRGSAQAFSYDHRARELSALILEREWDQKLEHEQRVFAYMPFEHSENLEDQQRCLALFRPLADEEMFSFVQLHHDIVAEFGRFPHRNEALGRESTPAEIEWLKTGHRFGQ